MPSRADNLLNFKLNINIKSMKFYGLPVLESEYCDGYYVITQPYKGASNQKYLLCKNYYDLLIKYEKCILKKLDLIKDKYIRELLKINK